MSLISTLNMRPFEGLAVHLDGLLFVLLIGITALFKLLTKKAGPIQDEEPESPVTRPETLPPPLPGTDEERIRKFLEALGQPATSKPPTPIRSRTATPPLTEFRRKELEKAARATGRRNLLNPLPPLTTLPPNEIPRRVTLPRSLSTEPSRAKIFTPAAAEGTVFEVQGKPAAITALPPTATDVEAGRTLVSTAAPAKDAPTEFRALFSSSVELRRAVVLRDVLGPPRGLQPFGHIGAESV